MTRLPRVAGSKVISALEKSGFFVVSTRGSHHMLKRVDGKSTVVPVHGREVIRPTLLTKILRDCEMTQEEFKDLL